jgi:hypothetical protein
MVIAILGVALVSSYSNIQTNHLNDSARLTGTVLVQVKDQNGTVVSQTKQDAITSISYDYIACLVWGTGCTLSDNTNCNVFPCGTTYTIATTITSMLPINTQLVGLILSTGTQTSNTCVSGQSTNGLAPLVASTSHSGGVNTPIITLTGSWTYTGTSVTITSVCLAPATTNAFFTQFPNAVSQISSAMAYENFAGQTLSSGQSITITWTFNM